MLLQCVGCPHNQIRIIRWHRAIVARKYDAGIICRSDADGVVQADGLKNSIDFVIAVGAPSQHAQAEINFGESRKFYRVIQVDERVALIAFCLSAIALAFKITDNKTKEE
jgi:hypothetical protein